jgi:hypothetical protein
MRLHFFVTVNLEWTRWSAMVISDASIQDLGRPRVRILALTRNQEHCRSKASVLKRKFWGTVGLDCAQTMSAHRRAHIEPHALLFKVLCYDDSSVVLRLWSRTSVSFFKSLHSRSRIFLKSGLWNPDFSKKKKDRIGY